MGGGGTVNGGRDEATQTSDNYPKVRGLLCCLWFEMVAFEPTWGSDPDFRNMIPAGKPQGYPRNDFSS